MKTIIGFQDTGSNLILHFVVDSNWRDHVELFPTIKSLHQFSEDVVKEVGAELVLEKLIESGLPNAEPWVQRFIRMYL